MRYKKLTAAVILLLVFNIFGKCTASEHAPEGPNSDTKKADDKENAENAKSVGESGEHESAPRTVNIQELIKEKLASDSVIDEEGIFCM